MYPSSYRSVALQRYRNDSSQGLTPHPNLEDSLDPANLSDVCETPLAGMCESLKRSAIKHLIKFFAYICECLALDLALDPEMCACKSYTRNRSIQYHL